MSEQFEWEQKLRAEGMPEELPPVEEELLGITHEVIREAQKPSFEKEISDMPDPLMRMAFDKFTNFPEDMQKVIIDKIKANRDTNMPLEEIKSRIYSLIEATYKMINMPPVETDESREEEPDERATTIDELIEKMEKLSGQQKAKEKDGLIN